MRRAGRRLALAALAILVAAVATIAVQPSWAFAVLSRAMPGILWRVETTRPLVALTFDDGPS